MVEETQLAIIKKHLYSDLVKKEFGRVVGDRHANAHVSSTFLAVANDDTGKLQECTPQSIVSSALRSASLGLSVDPAKKEGFLIPRNKKVKKDGKEEWIKQASFEPHYLGLYKLAMRTNKYLVINVIPVMKGFEVRMGMDGLHWIFKNNVKIDHFPISKITAKNLDGVQGWLGFFETVTHFKKTEYMTVEEIMDHAEEHSDAAKNKYSLWGKESKHLATMQMKTVLRALLKWADLSGDDNATLRSALEDNHDDYIDGEVIPIQGDEHPPRSEEQNMKELGFGTKPKKKNEVIDADVDDAFPPPPEEPQGDELTREYKDGKYPSAHAFVIDQLILEGIFEEREQAERVMHQCVFQGKSIEDFVRYGRAVQGWIDSGLNETDAIREANRGKPPK